MRARALAAGLAILAGAPPALAAGTPAPILDSARLQGFYGVAGVVTKAVGVPGERRGEHVSRTWAFLPMCPTGACPTIKLVRTRATGKDTLLLYRRSPALYSGAGSFLAPVRCHGRLYRKGELATFTITVRITAAALQGAVVQATGFRATYTGGVRTGLTRCFSAPSYDSARYVAAPPAVAAIRSVASTRLSNAS